MLTVGVYVVRQLKLQLVPHAVYVEFMYVCTVNVDRMGQLVPKVSVSVGLC